LNKARRSALASATLTTLVLLVLPVAADASSTATYTPRISPNGEPDEVDPSFIEVDGDAGKNTISLSYAGNDVAITDGSGITAGSHCAQVNPTEVTCPSADGSLVVANGGDDTVDAQMSLHADVEAGPGDDTVTTAGDITGDEGSDVLTGSDTSFGQLIDGGPGDDTLSGGAVGDRLIGGTGKDTLDGGPGDDKLDGDEPASPDALEQDTIEGGDGRDLLDWSSRNAAVSVNLADPAPDGAAGESDQIRNVEDVSAGAGNDTIVGTDGPNRIDPGAGKDQVTAGGGNDEAAASLGDDVFDLGAGSDTISYRDSELPVTVNLSDSKPDGAKGSLDTLRGVENVIGSQPQDDFKGDTLVGDRNANTLVGLLGSDRIRGGGGNDKLYGEGRPSDIDGSPADGAQLDLTYPAVDRLTGGSGKDLLVGGIDGDVLDGGSGNDRMLGDSGPGFHGGEPKSAGAVDIVSYASRSTRIKASTRSGGGARGEHDSYSGVEGIRGGSGNDVLTGRPKLSDLLIGGRGHDRLTGLSGKDKLLAADGQRDVVDCGADRDRFSADRKDRVRGCELAARASSANEKPVSCARKGSTTIVRNSLVRVYETKDRDWETSTHLTIYGCSLKTGKRLVVSGYVDSQSFSDADEARPTIWLNKEAVAANHWFCPPDGSPCTGRVRSFDVRQRKQRYIEDVPGGVISQLVLKSNGSLAYVAGDGTVRKADSNGVGQLDAGPGIEKGSLARAGSIVYWTKAGEPFSARIS
jgi:Ca2+-binding RTX toxin-like protein